MTRVALCFAVLVFGIHSGAAIYEALVVTPVWAGEPPQSVRSLHAATQVAVQPLSYKLPAIVVLGFTAFILFSVAIGDRVARGWTLLAALLGLTIAIATVLHGIPILTRTVIDGGSGLTDAQIVADVRAWLLWSHLRLAAIFIAWIAALAALMRQCTRPRRLFASTLRLR